MRAGWKAAVKALSPVPQDVLFMHAYRSPAVQRRVRVPQKQISTSDGQRTWQHLVQVATGPQRPSPGPVLVPALPLTSHVAQGQALTVLVGFFQKQTPTRACGLSMWRWSWGPEGRSGRWAGRAAKRVTAEVALPLCPYLPEA